MRALPVLAAALVACTTAANVRTAITDEIAVSLSRDSASAKPTLLVRVTNHSPHQICIWRDAIQNPYSYEMNLKMRDGKGRAVRYNEPGYIDEPLEGVVRLEPGAEVEGRFYIHPRFKLQNQGRPFPRGMSIRVSFSYHHCNEPTELRATSSWQRI
jgi:hypothetical protein